MFTVGGAYFGCTIIPYSSAVAAFKFKTGFNSSKHSVTTSSVNTEGSTIAPVVYLYDTVFGGTGIVERDAGAGAAVGVVLTLIIIAVYVIMNKVLKDTDLEY